MVGAAGDCYGQVGIVEDLGPFPEGVGLVVAISGMCAHSLLIRGKNKVPRDSECLGLKKILFRANLE